MAKATRYHNLRDADAQHASPSEEDQGLLTGNVSDDEDIIVHAGDSTHPGEEEDAPKTPRSANRVRFNLPPPSESPASDGAPPPYETSNDIPLSGRRESSSQQAPFLNGTPTSWAERASDASAEALAHLNRPKSSLQSAMSNMANSIIGAGIIGQPYALRQAGFATGVVLLVALTVTVDWTIRLIVINSKMSGRESFQGTVEYCFGKVGLVAISLAQWAFAFGGMVAYGVVVGDSIPHVLEAVFPGLGQVPVLGLLTQRRVVIFILTMSISWPLSLYRDIAKLAKASTLALISMVIILIAVVTQSFSVPQESRGTFGLQLWTINGGVFQAIGVISFAFVCHHNSLLIYDSLHTPTLDRFNVVTHISTFVSLLACLLLALSGFLTFGSLTQGNVLNNFPATNTVINVARFCFGLNMLTTLPLEAFVCREVMFNYFLPGKIPSTRQHVAVSTGLVVSSMVISLVVCDLGAVFELIGATSACALAYILPPLCYIKLSRRKWREMLPAIGCVVFGFVVMIISVVQAVTKIVTSSGGTAQCH